MYTVSIFKSDAQDKSVWVLQQGVCSAHMSSQSLDIGFQTQCYHLAAQLRWISFVPDDPYDVIPIGCRQGFPHTGKESSGVESEGLLTAIQSFHPRWTKQNKWSNTS